MGRLPVKRHFLGDTCVTWTWANTISREISNQVLGAYRRLKLDRDLQRLGMLDVVPSYSSLALYFKPTETDRKSLFNRAEHIIAEYGEGQEAYSPPRDPFLFPVVYAGQDLARVASNAGLGVKEVIELHSRPAYTVAMIGFLPHFPYLIGLDKRLATPRLADPRKSVPAGSVAIGGAQTGIYPRESPGGWNLIGVTNPGTLVHLRPGDTIIFQVARFL